MNRIQFSKNSEGLVPTLKKGAFTIVPAVQAEKILIISLYRMHGTWQIIFVRALTYQYMEGYFSVN